MILESLWLKYFRNYSECSFSFNPRLNFIFGDNGNGKTNIFEAISFLCYTKSFLQSPEPDCVKYGENRLEVAGVFLDSLSMKNRVSFEYDRQSSRKSLALNNEQITRFGSFFGKVPLVVLSPGDIRLTKGPPGERRRSFDILISQISRLYYDDIRSYNRAIKQKNSLLKENFIQRKYSHEKLHEMVDMWNKEIIELGVKIILKRIEIAREFQKYLVNNFKSIVGEAYVPLVRYESEMVGSNSASAPDGDEIRHNFRRVLDEKLILEVRRGMSLAGPQRDNYSFAMSKNGDEFELKSFASQGEHKTFLVALRLSEYIYLNDKYEGGITGEPVLLLDDIFSELDKGRVEKICSILPAFSQVFVSTTEKGYLSNLKKHFQPEDISVFNIVNGSVKANNRL